MKLLVCLRQWRIWSSDLIKIDLNQIIFIKLSCKYLQVMFSRYSDNMHYVQHYFVSYNLCVIKLNFNINILCVIKLNFNINILRHIDCCLAPCESILLSRVQFNGFYSRSTSPRKPHTHERYSNFSYNDLWKNPFNLSIVLSVLRFTDSDYRFGIFKLVLYSQPCYAIFNVS